MSSQKTAEDTEEPELTKEQHIKNYLIDFDFTEKNIEPFRQHKQAMKESYAENGWLTRAEMSLILKAYRMHKGEVDMDSLNEFFDIAKKL